MNCDVVQWTYNWIEWKTAVLQCTSDSMLLNYWARSTHPHALTLNHRLRHDLTIKTGAVVFVLSTVNNRPVCSCFFAYVCCTLFPPHKVQSYRKMRWAPTNNKWHLQFSTSISCYTDVLTEHTEYIESVCATTYVDLGLAVSWIPKAVIQWLSDAANFGTVSYVIESSKTSARNFVELPLVAGGGRWAQRITILY